MKAKDAFKKACHYNLKVHAYGESINKELEKIYEEIKKASIEGCFSLRYPISDKIILDGLNDILIYFLRRNGYFITKNIESRYIWISW